MNINLEFKPSTLEHIQTKRTSERCYAVNWVEFKQVLCVTRSGIDLMDSGLEFTNEIMTDDTLDFWSANIVGRKLITKVSQHYEGNYTTYFGSLVKPTEMVLHRVDGEESNGVRHPAISKHCIADIQSNNKTLKIFSSTNEEHLFELPIKGNRIPIWHTHH